MGLTLQEISNIPTSPLYPAHDSVLDYHYAAVKWSLAFDGDISFLSPMLRDNQVLKRDGWYRAYNDIDPLHPVSTIRIYSVNPQKTQPCQDDCFYNEVTGGQWIPALADNGIYIVFNTNRIKFIDVMRRFISELSSKSRGIFSLDDRFIEDYNYYFDLFKFKNYAGVFIDYMRDLGFILYFDSWHRLHAHHETTHYQTIYSPIFAITGNVLTLDDATWIRPDLPLQLVKRVNGIDTFIQNITWSNPYQDNITFDTLQIDELISYQANLHIKQIQPNFVEFNLDSISIFNTIKAIPPSEAPVSQWIIKADNVLSSDWGDPELFYQANNNNGLSGLDLGSLQVTYRPQIFTLLGKPADPRLYQEDMTGGLELLDIASTLSSDDFVNGRLIINSVTGSLFNTHYRNFKNDFDSDNGLLVGGSIQIHQRTGNIGLLGLQLSPSDLPNQWIAGFTIDNTELKVVINGQVYSTGFMLIPSTEQAISNFTSNTITVSNGALYEIGQDIIFTNNVGDSVGTGRIVSIVGNIITLDEVIGNLQIGYNALQVADYLIKYSYVKDNIIFYAKKGTDARFTKLYDGSLITSRNAFVQLYANREHGISFDFVDIVDSFNIRAIRKTPNTYFNSTCGAGAVSQTTDYITSRVYDIAFAEQASRLQADLQVYQDGDVYKVQLPVLDNSDEFLEDYFIIEQILTGNSYKLFDIGGLAAGDRMLFDGQLAYIESIDNVNKIIYLDRILNNVTLETFVLRSDVHLANDEILCVEYKQVISLTMPICSSCCSEGVATTSRIESINISERMTYEELRLYAQSQIDKTCCDSTYEGTIDYAIKHGNNLDTCDNDYHKWWDQAFAGQHIKLKSECNIALNNKYIVVKNVLYTEESQCTYKVSISLNDSYIDKIADVLLRRFKLIEGKAVLINDDLPDKDLICSLDDQLIIRDDIANLYNFRPCQAFNSGLFNTNVSGGVCSKYIDIDLNLTETIARTKISGTAVSGDLVNIWH